MECKYWFHITVYESANMYEVPVRLPDYMVQDGHLKIGTFEANIKFVSEADFDTFYEWASKHQLTLKINGHEPIA